MGYTNRYDIGDWKAICDICGREYKASYLRKRWDGFMVCPDDWESRHPQDFVRGVADTQVPVWTRPEASDTFITVQGYWTPTLAIAGQAIAGQAIAGVGPGPSWLTPMPQSTFIQD